MPTLIPKVAIEEISVKSERDIAKAFMATLPNDCIIYHSYPWLRSDRNDRGHTTLREGETDFIVILPSHGVLVVEVKGGDIQYDEASRNWSRLLPSGGLRAIQDPFEQVRRNMHYLMGALRKLAFQGDKLPFSFGYAVVFPDCDYQGQTPPGSEPAIVMSAKDLPFIDRRIISALNQWSRTDKVIPMTKEQVQNIARVISPAFNLTPVLFRQVAEQEEQLLRLTEEQSNLMLFLGQNNRACIEGVAGSGKTLLAVSHAVSLAQEGKSVLIVCYNKVLAGWINSSIPPEFKKLITTINFHALCDQWVRKAGLEFAVPADGMSEFWQRTAPDMLTQAIALLPDRFDAVIVDEGQDFQPDWWLPLELINTNEESGDMFVFYDSRQNLYVEQKESMPDLGQLFKLPTNCRNTQCIATKCSSILDIDVPTRKSSPIGQDPIEVTLDNSADICKQMEAWAKNWLKKGNLQSSQIAILSPWTLAKSSAKDTRTISGTTVTQDVELWKANKGILFSTIKSFKGLEADAIILIDIPVNCDEKYFKEADLYVACSRAKHLLSVIYKQ